MELPFQPAGFSKMNPEPEPELCSFVRSEDQVIQYVQETTNSVLEQQSQNPALNPHILNVFEDPRVIETMIVMIDKL